MDLDTALYKGNKNKPAIVFIHGLGMDKNIWANPSISRVLAGGFPIKIILGKKPSRRDFGISTDIPVKGIPKFTLGEQPETLQTLFYDFRNKGNTVITWSQKRPAGPMDSVVSELSEIIKKTRGMTKAGIILVGHSRGGLVGRKYLFRKDRSIRGLVTVSTPHKGSSLAKLAKYISPLLTTINPFFSHKERGTLSFAIKRISEFLRSKALKEILPDSECIQSLRDVPCEWVSYVSAGGTNPTLLSVYRWRWDAVSEGAYRRWFLDPDELFSIPDILEKVLPKNLYPEEMKKGRGDGLVSVESSKIPWDENHYTFHYNHAEILFDEGVRKTLVRAIENIQ